MNSGPMTRSPRMTNNRPRTLRYGLPCSGCRLYYEAELNACPVCSCETRVGPSPTNRPQSAAMSLPVMKEFGSSSVDVIPPGNVPPL